MADLWILRVAVLAISLGASWLVRPFGLEAAPSLALGAAVAILAMVAEVRLRRTSLRRLIGAAVGFVAGLSAAALIVWVLESVGDDAWIGPVQLGVLLALGYTGLAVGGAKGAALNLAAYDLFGAEAGSETSNKILDTSVIIDGRIADIAEAGFMDSTLIIPQFVLWELQLVADSSDSLKRNRGRRGLDVLQRIQKMQSIDVRIVENDYPKLKEVDQKLIELAKEMQAKIVTNDFNLNKLAQLHGIGVLNINELANSLKPIVLPGETMKVFILKEGKEQFQGVAYLDDGTMVVVDNARKQISKTIEIIVTSVLQTTAGKMIFGRYEAPEHSTGSLGPAPATDRRRGAGSAKAYQKVEHAAGK